MRSYMLEELSKSSFVKHKAIITTDDEDTDESVFRTSKFFSLNLTKILSFLSRWNFKLYIEINHRIEDSSAYVEPF